MTLNSSLIESVFFCLWNWDNKTCHVYCKWKLDGLKKIYLFICQHLLEVYSGKGWPEVQRWLGQKWNGGGGDTKITKKKKKKERERLRPEWSANLNDIKWHVIITTRSPNITHQMIKYNYKNKWTESVPSLVFQVWFRAKPENSE